MWANANCGRALGRRAAVCSLTLLLLAAIRARGADATGAAPPREPGSSALESLFAHWQSRQNDITTARLSYRSFHNSVEGRRTPAELDQLLESGLLDRTPEGFRGFIAAMNGGPFRIDPPWGEGRITIRDAQRRSELGPFTSLVDREICVDYDSLNNQFDVAMAGGSQHRSDDLLTFRPLPPGPWTPDRWQILEQQTSRWRLRRILSPPGVEPQVLDGRTWEVDRDTGLVTRIVSVNEAGNVMSLAAYLDPVELPGGVMFPQAFVEAVFQDGVATVMHVCVIDAIAVNEPVPDSAFALPAARNSLIVDERGPHTLVSRLKQEQSDISRWLKEHAPVAAAAVRRSPPVDHTVRNLLFTANGLLLVVVGLALWKRQRRVDPTKSRSSTPVACTSGANR